MCFEDIACMNPTDAEVAIKELLAIVAAVAILGQGMPITHDIEKAARRFL